ncbi:tryptophan--tRNA ligase [Methanonatronarchaeum sp. AMET-Sl]|uniref:tryptophan--tRNA ligase n=1 Tax=Methanonatronarchaeum sp. AMET-Sl TaxID=3037654 RepID=UPI00244DDB94|nr:tryptophan--tRNA ligase [Methanonatronarchaeum sp. AMET-Sl]WGI18156.1 tryptophan--tRNA ligase [Methanonatronarchaeum sp. AMET-Sl]
MDPWTSDKIDDYGKLKKEFGIQDLNPETIPNPHHLIKRQIVFGHRDLNYITQAIKQNKPFAAMSGFVPTGQPHFGHKMVMDQLIWYQQQGGQIFAAIADMEARAARDLPLKQSYKSGKNYLTSLIALGLDPEKAYIYYQSQDYGVRNLAFEASNKMNYSELKSIYGFNNQTTLAHMYAAPIQSADILYPQTQKFGGPKPVVVPAGTDQDPHLRLVRDVSKRMRLFSTEKTNNHYKIRSRHATQKQINQLKQKLNKYGETKTYEEHIEIKTNNPEIPEITRQHEIQNNGYGFYPPSSTYHRFMTGLKGGKMSSSVEDSYIALTDNPQEAADKVMKAKTGGRETLKQQKKQGGEPEKCAIYELLYFHLIKNDKQIEETYKNCQQGERLCGKCKKETAQHIKQFLKTHQEKRKQAKEKLEKHLKQNHKPQEEYK